MTTTSAFSRRKPRGRYPKTQDGAAPKREKRIPEYLEAEEMNAIIRAAPSPKAKLLMLEQWRAGLRVSGGAGHRKCATYRSIRHSRRCQCAFRQGR